jgi:hypothetical protein
MTRHGFSQQTKYDLAAAAGYYCARCPKRTHFYSSTEHRWIHVGNASHDSAASPGGPRYDVELTEAQRRAYENGCWLCATCATLVDADPDAFPPGALRRLQEQAESRIRDAVHRPAPSAQATPREAAFGASNFLKRVDAIRLNLGAGLDERAIGAIKLLLQDARSLEPLNELSAQHPAQIDQQRRVLQSLKNLVAEVMNSGAWYRDEFGSYVPQPVPFGPQEERERVRQSLRRAELHLNDAQSAVTQLRQFALHGGRD